VLVQAFDDFLVESAQFADLVLKNCLNVVLAELIQVFQADESV
jgi:hypothetical protein